MSVDDALRGGSLSASFLHSPDAAVSSTTSHSTAALQGPSSASSSIPQQPISKSSHAQQFPSNPHSNNSDILDLPDLDDLARNELLRGDVFPEWRDDSGGDVGLESPEELQKKDPLGAQIWKLYARTKTRLPNQERMENLTWRMMAMNLRRREQMQAAYALPFYHLPETCILTFKQCPTSRRLHLRPPVQSVISTSSYSPCPQRYCSVTEVVRLFC